jgi:hypothetical protein
VPWSAIGGRISSYPGVIRRFNLLWYVKAGIAMYALAVMGSHLPDIPPARPQSSGRRLLVRQSAAYCNTRSNVTTILLWALWLIVPLGYFSMLVQQIFINPMSMVNPLAGAQDLLRALRVRDSHMDP